MRTVCRAGFTLVEILVVIGILVVLAAIITPAVVRAKVEARTVDELSALRQIHVALELYRGDYGKDPPNVPQMVKAGYSKPHLYASFFDALPEGMANWHRGISAEMGIAATNYKDSRLPLTELAGPQIVQSVSESKGAGWLVSFAQRPGDTYPGHERDSVLARQWRGRYLRVLNDGAVVRRWVTVIPNAAGQPESQSHWLFTDEPEKFIVPVK